MRWFALFSADEGHNAYKYLTIVHSPNIRPLRKLVLSKNYEKNIPAQRCKRKKPMVSMPVWQPKQPC